MTNQGAESIRQWAELAKYVDANPTDNAKILRTAMGGLSTADADEFSAGFAGALKKMGGTALAALKTAVDAETDARA